MSDLTKKVDDLQANTDRRLTEQSNEHKLYMADMDKRFTDALKEDRCLTAEARKADQDSLQKSFIQAVSMLAPSITENILRVVWGESIPPSQINGGTNADVSTLSPQIIISPHDYSKHIDTTATTASKSIQAEQQLPTAYHAPPPSNCEHLRQSAIQANHRLTTTEVDSDHSFGSDTDDDYNPNLNISMTSSNHDIELKMDFQEKEQKQLFDDDLIGINDHQDHMWR